MATNICSCASPMFPNGGDPRCLIEMATIAFIVIVPTLDDTGAVNSIDVSSPTVGQDIKDRILATIPVNSRLYPQPRVENATFDRTDTEYETLPSGNKAKTGAGGVRTFAWSLWKKQSSNMYLRELEKLGCTDVSFFTIDQNGNWWGIKDELTSNLLRGYKMDVETFDAYREYALDNTRQEIMVSFDLDKYECESNSYVITKDELGYDATTLRGNLSGYQTLTALLSTELQSVVFTGNGTANDRDDIEGLVLADFTVYNVTTDSAIVASGVVETVPGSYTITIPAQTASDVIRVSISASGYDVADSTVAAL